MAAGYLILAIALVVGLNAGSRWFRAAGTLVAALSLVMIVLSILLADFDGTFAAIPADAALIDRWTPAILNGQAALACAAVLFLGWSAWRQVRHPVAAPLAIANSPAGYGRVSRYFHWSIAVLMFCLVPIGLFMAVLAENSPERAGFVAAHQSLGLTVLVLAVLRLAWFLFSPRPRPIPGLTRWEARASGWVHVLLYAVLLAFPVSGYVLSASGGAPIAFYDLVVPNTGQPGALVSAAAGCPTTGCCRRSSMAPWRSMPGRC